MRGRQEKDSAGTESENVTETTSIGPGLQNLIDSGELLLVVSGPTNIEYTDLYGDVTNRTISQIHIHDGHEEDAGRLIEAYCHLKNAWKTFNISRVIVKNNDGSSTSGPLYFHKTLSEIARRRGWAWDPYIEIEACEIANNINTRKQYSSLENRYNSAIQRYASSASFGCTSSKGNTRHRVLGLAVRKAFSKYRAFQFMPSLSLSTCSTRLSFAYYTCVPDRCRELRQKYDELSTKVDWWPLCIHHEPEQRPLELGALMAFRKIVESTLPFDQQMLAINEAVLSRQKDFERLSSNMLCRNLFCFKSDLTPAQQWLSENLYKQGVPCASLFVRAGFSTIEEIFNAEPSHLLAIKGIGPKSLERLNMLRASVSGV